MEVLIVCQEGRSTEFTFSYGLDPDTETARFITTDGVDRIGELVATETNYTMKFPGTTTHYPMEVRINRITGAMQREFGNDPLFDPRGLMGNGNLLYSGSCKATTVRF
jgi:hypothetical protein